jgi:nicotinamidase-related amidase
MFIPHNTALVIIDVQQAIDDPRWARWGSRNNPQAEENIARLLAAWRAAQRPIVHVRHMSREPQSPYRPQQPGNEFKLQVAPLPQETIVEKSTNSAFISTTLEADLRGAQIDTLIITGVITNNSVEATARMAGNLGFNTLVVADATATFARPDFNGVLRTADEVHAMSLANLENEYAAIVTTSGILAALGIS